MGLSELLLLWPELGTGSLECQIITELLVLLHTVAKRANPLDYQTFFGIGKLHVYFRRKSEELNRLRDRAILA